MLFYHSAVKMEYENYEKTRKKIGMTPGASVRLPPPSAMTAPTESYFQNS